MRVSGNYRTHFAPIIQCIGLTSGDVLKMGMGFFITPYLHYQCMRFAYSTFANHKYHLKSILYSNIEKYRTKKIGKLMF